jgi:hypothetical protein
MPTLIICPDEVKCLEIGSRPKVEVEFLSKTKNQIRLSGKDSPTVLEFTWQLSRLKLIDLIAFFRSVDTDAQFDMTTVTWNENKCQNPIGLYVAATTKYRFREEPKIERNGHNNNRVTVSVEAIT